MTKYVHKKDSDYHSVFSAVSEKPHPTLGENYRGVVDVRYIHPKETPNFESHGGRLEYLGYGGPPRELFRNQQGQVHEAFADPSMKGHVPNVLGLVMDYSKRLTGGQQLPMPDSSLSKHSSRMVQHIRKKGVDLPKNPGNPESRRSNDLGFTTHVAHVADIPFTYPESDVLSAEQVDVGRKAIRNVLRPPATPQPVDETPTEGFRGRPQEGRYHQGALFSSRQLAATQRKAGFSPASTQRVTQAPKPQPSEGVVYHYEHQGYADSRRVIAMHPQHGVVGMLSLGRRSWGDEQGVGLGVDTRYLNKNTPTAMRSAVNETMLNVAHHELGYTPKEGTYGGTRARNARPNMVPAGPGKWATESHQIDSHLSRLLTPYTAQKAPRGRQPKQLRLDI